MVVEACVSSPRLTGSTNSVPGSAEVAAAAAETAADVGPDGAVGSGGAESRRREKSTTAARAAAGATEGAVTFGGFASGSQWKNMGRSFAGDGGSFLFAFAAEGSSGSAGEQAPFEEDGIYGGGGGSAGDGAGLRVYPWSRKDRCFMTSDDAVGLGMGGGGSGGNFGFLLSEDLRSGSTGRCETFENPPLVQAVELGGGVGGSAGVAEGRGAVYDVLSVEVWGFRAAKAPEGLTRIAL